VVTGRPPCHRNRREEREEGDDTRGERVSVKERADGRERANLALLARAEGSGQRA
jgi:hypothetical protein